MPVRAGDGMDQLVGEEKLQNEGIVGEFQNDENDAGKRVVQVQDNNEDGVNDESSVDSLKKDTMEDMRSRRNTPCVAEKSSNR